jgi:hypothetical protein
LVPNPSQPTQSLIFKTGYELPDRRVVDWETAVTMIDDPNLALRR